MHDVLLILTGAASAFVGLVFGRRLGRRELPPKPEKPSLTCGCKHVLAMHDPKNGTCHDTVKKPNKYNKYGDVSSYEHVQCTCKQYTGAKPIDSLFSPPLYQGDET